MRLFVAVVPPQEALDHVAAALAPLRDEAIRWTVVDSWHVTLAFYGELDDARVADLTGRLGRAAARHPSGELAFAGAGRFDGRVLWIGCRGDTDRVRRLARSVGAAGRRAGADVDEQRRFRAHLTVARSSRPVDLRPYVAALAGYAGPTWPVTQIALIRSQLGAGDDRRAKYETLATFDLAELGGTAGKAE
jgi:2'-5' RNA ligase